MSGNDDAREREANEANDKLNQGLKSCRAVVSNYRALLDKKRARRAGNSADDAPDGGDAPAA